MAPTNFKPYSGYIRMEFDQIREGVRGILGRFGLIRIVS